MTKPPKSGIETVRAVVLDPTGPGSLYRWLRRHHDEVVDTLSQVPRPNWFQFSQAMEALGLKDGHGKPPNSERVRQTWIKVRKDVAAARSRKSPPLNVPPPVLSQAPEPDPLPAIKWTPTKLK